MFVVGVEQSAGSIGANAVLVESAVRGGDQTVPWTAADDRSEQQTTQGQVQGHL